ncbi:MAG: hypothetical protein P8Z75_08160 [Gammaproteobacteria bacterium]|jgi:hypothetical protein
MTNTELDQYRKNWQLNAAQFSRILCLHSTKISEYLAGVTRIPCSVAMHIEALALLPEQTRMSLFEKRLKRKAHDNVS